MYLNPNAPRRYVLQMKARLQRPDGTESLISDQFCLPDPESNMSLDVFFRTNDEQEQVEIGVQAVRAFALSD